MSSWRSDKRRAGGDPDLLDDEVDAGDHLGDGVLDLKARVHLDEIELAGLVKELDGSDARDSEACAWPAATVSPICTRSLSFSAGEGASSQSF